MDNNNTENASENITAALPGNETGTAGENQAQNSAAQEGAANASEQIARKSAFEFLGAAPDLAAAVEETEESQAKEIKGNPDTGEIPAELPTQEPAE